MRAERAGTHDARFDAFVSYSHAADGLLAPRLAAGLQRFAKPWYRPRAMRVFRDEASLSANPHLWSSITQALDQSEWFVLLLSPDAAKSEWVNKEVEYWLENKPADRILPVVTDGEFTWNGQGPITPPALTGAFTEEPRWVDLRFARTDEQLDLKSPRFSAAIADIASAVRDIPKDQLESEEVSQHRRTLRTAWAGVALVAALAVLAAVFAVRSGRDARLADARALVASAVNLVDDDPELAVLLILAAVEQAPTDEVLFQEARIALREAASANRLEHRYTMGSGNLFIDLSDDGQTIVASDETGLWLADASTGERTTTFQTDQPYWFPSFSPDESLVVASQRDQDPAVDVFDRASGELIVSLTTTGQYTVAAPGFSFSPDGAFLQLLTIDDDSAGRIEFYDSETWTRTHVLEDVGPQAYASFSETGDRILVSGDPALLLTFPDLEVLDELPSTAYGAIHPDGAIAFITNQQLTQELRPIVYDLEQSQPIDLADGVSDFLVAPIRVSPDGERVFFSTRGKDVLSDAHSGQQLLEFPSLATNSAAFSADGSRLVTSHPEGQVRVWDLGDRQLSGTILDPIEYTPQFVNADRLSEGPAMSLWLLDNADPSNRWLSVIDPNGFVVASIQIAESVPLPDGRFAVVPWREDVVGPLSVWDPKTYSLTRIDDCAVPTEEFNIDDPPVTCGDEPFPLAFSMSPDGSELYASTQDDGASQVVFVLDSMTLDVIRTFETTAPIGAIGAVGDGWMLAMASSFSVVDTQTGEVIHTMDDRTWRGSNDLSDDGSVLYLGDQAGRVVAFDTITWDIVDEWQAHNGSNRGLATSQDGSLLATTGDDDVVKLWRTADHSLLDQVTLPFPADATFLDSSTIGVISTLTPTWFVIDLDPEDLLASAQASVTRDLTAEECRLYGVKECPDG